jgi:ABC-type antimicrobial peptide transport system permease subunit
VVGVARDVIMPRFIRNGLDVDLYLPTALDTPGTQLAIRVRDDPFRARTQLMERLGAVAPTLGAVTTLRTTVGLIGFLMQSLFAIGLTLGSLALLLTASGLFSVLSYIVEQRTREIGVRMALGASARSVMRLLFADSGMPVGIGLLVGGLLAAGVAEALMASPIASDIAVVVSVFDPAAYAMALMVIVLACAAATTVPALRAVSVNPSMMLRKD